MPAGISRRAAGLGKLFIDASVSRLLICSVTRLSLRVTLGYQNTVICLDTLRYKHCLTHKFNHCKSSLLFVKMVLHC
jgi:hypothetical protein